MPGLFIGTCGWSYDDWKPIVFAGLARKDSLRHMVKWFNALEINVSFYRPIPSKTAEGWLRRVQSRSDFQFTAKLHQRFTHQRAGDIYESEVNEFMAGMKPLLRDGRLAAILAQFPWSFKDTPPERDWLSRLRIAFAATPLVVELRHDSWLTDNAADFLRDLRLNWCNIDQPPHEHNIPPLDWVTGPIGYIRLHGRNHAQWFDHDEAYQRYDYLYTEQELKEWMPRIEQVRRSAPTTFVFTNNHFRGQAVANALELVARVTGEPVEVPRALLAEYPQLARFAATPKRAEQGLLF